MKMKKSAVLGAMLLSVLAVGSVSLDASPLDREKYFTVTGFEMFDVTDGHEVLVDRHTLTGGNGGGEMPMNRESKGITWPKIGGRPAPAPTPQSKVGDIIAIGSKVWDIIEKNRPAVTQNYSAISAVPFGVKSWEELEGWSEPTQKVYKVQYTNVYKMKVVEFEYRIGYTAHGTFEGKGQYLSRVEVEPKTLKVLWGYKFNASGMILNVTNMGTKENPIAAMELNLNWSVESMLKHMGRSVRYYIRGDGLFKDLADGSITP